MASSQVGIEKRWIVIIGFVLAVVAGALFIPFRRMSDTMSGISSHDDTRPSLVLVRRSDTHPCAWPDELPEVSHGQR